MTQADKAKAFAELHIKGDPIILFNIWDAASAKRVGDAGAKALATGSHSVAEVLGYEDGEGAPFEDMLWMLERIVRSTDLPVSNDTERGYSSDPSGIAENCARVISPSANRGTRSLSFMSMRPIFVENTLSLEKLTVTFSVMVGSDGDHLNIILVGS